MQVNYLNNKFVNIILILVGTLCMVAVAQQKNQYSENNSMPTTNSELQTSNDWSLTVEEIETLNRLKRINKGMLSNDITPMEWLGIFADSDEQRNHYATLFAKRQLEVMDAITKFEHAYAVAMKHEIQQKSSSDRRLLLVTPYQCKDEICKSYLTRALDHAKNGGRLDILIRETISDTQMNHWIASNEIPQEKIRSRTITVQSARRRYQHLSFGIFELN